MYRYTKVINYLQKKLSLDIIAVDPRGYRGKSAENRGKGSSSLLSDDGEIFSADNVLLPANVRSHLARARSP